MNMMTKSTDDNTYADELITGYFAQELSAQELEELRNWLNASTENKAYFENNRKSGFPQ